MNITACYCKIGSEFYSENRINNNYGYNTNNEVYKEFIGFIKDLNRLEYFIKPHINYRTFKSDYINYTFDRRY